MRRSCSRRTGTSPRRPPRTCVPVRDGAAATPRLLTDDVLPGITRQAVITLALDAGYLVEERKIDRTELYLSR